MTEGTNEGPGALFNAPDAGNQGPGDALRRAREAQRISIEVMAANIKVSVAKLDALESGRFNELPDANFTRALAMTLCRVLKLEPAEVLAGLPAARQVAWLSETPSLNQPFKASRSSIHLFDRSVDWTGFLKPTWLAPAGLLAAAVVLYSVPGSSEWPQRMAGWFHPAPAAHVPDAGASDAEASASSPGDEVTPPVPTGLPQDLAQPASEPALPSVVPARPTASEPARTDLGAKPTLKLDTSDGTAAAATVPTDPAPPSVAPVMSAANSMLSLRANQATWVEIKDAQGNRLLGRLVQRDEAVDMSVPPPLTLRIGNAAGMTLSFKGQVVDLVPYTRNNVARLELK